mmetsp:Transcript_4968/g.4565  ORF Transcript_4968/g.4565 Transcript_4968/m.4565 type:complete len:85 (-) Transcript_4968:121-375(-)
MEYEEPVQKSTRDKRVFHKRNDRVYLQRLKEYGTITISKPDPSKLKPIKVDEMNIGNFKERYRSRIQTSSYQEKPYDYKDTKQL